MAERLYIDAFASPHWGSMPCPRECDCVGRWWRAMCGLEARLREIGFSKADAYSLAKGER